MPKWYGLQGLIIITAGHLTARCKAALKAVQHAMTYCICQRCTKQKLTVSVYSVDQQRNKGRER
jgi:hypothetical protein